MGESLLMRESKSTYREFLISTLCATYYLLELVNPEDILKAVDYVLPGQKKMNKQAVRRALDLSEFFTRITNPQWQVLYWKDARNKLAKLHAKSKDQRLHLPLDPLDLEEEFVIARSVLDHFGL